MSYTSARMLAMLLLALALTFGAACRSSDTGDEEAGDETAEEEAGTQEPETQEPAPPELKPVVIEAENPEWEKRAQDLVRGRTAGEQQKIYQSQQHYQLALAYQNKGDFEKARIEAQKAVECWHENLEARKLLNEIQQVIIGGRQEFGARALGEKEVAEWKVKVEQAQIEITKHIRDGERFFNARMYEEAIKEFENAEFKIVHIPYDVKAMNDLLPSVRSYVIKSKNARILEERAVEDEKRQMSEAEAAAHDVTVKREVIRKIAHLLDLAYMAFDQKRFERCVKLSEEILLIDPHYTVAKELKEDAIKTRHKEEYYAILLKKVVEWKKLTSTDEAAVIPWSQTVRFPSREEWEEISKRISESVIKQAEGGVGQEEDPEILAIERKLDTMKIDMAFENTKFEDILSFLRDFTGLNIVLDANVRDNVDMEKPLTFKVKDLALKSALKLLLSQFGLDYHVDETKVVMLTTPAAAGGKAILELHDIRDILIRIQDFQGPVVELVAPGKGGAGGPMAGAQFTLDEPHEQSVGEAQIVDLIKENIAPGTWEGEYTIEKTPNQQLLVNAVPKVQRELREFLGKLRSYTGTMISITCRFVAAYDDFLDDVGVDIIKRAAGADGGGVAWGAGAYAPWNLPRPQPPFAGHLYDITGTSALTTIVEQTGEIGAGFQTQESARVEAYDLRGQTFHTLVKFDPLTGTGQDPMSGRLSDQGGLGMQYDWLGEQNLQAVLRALHKEQKGTTLQAPSITVFNMQRSHIMFLTQMAYIMDFEPQVSTLAAAYDPVMGILTHGAVLDVRPIVSNDRKYVTLELRPALANLIAMRTIDIRPAGVPGAAKAPALMLQLPYVVLQKAETTVMIPDRSTLMISGFKDLEMIDAKSTVPFLEHIPVVSFFFTKKGKTDESRRLLILVTPEIIDLAEREDQQF